MFAVDVEVPALWHHHDTAGRCVYCAWARRLWSRRHLQMSQHWVGTASGDGDLDSTASSVHVVQLPTPHSCQQGYSRRSTCCLNNTLLLLSGENTLILLHRKHSTRRIENCMLKTVVLLVWEAQEVILQQNLAAILIKVLIFAIISISEFQSTESLLHWLDNYNIVLSL